MKKVLYLILMFIVLVEGTIFSNNSVYKFNWKRDGIIVGIIGGLGLSNYLIDNSNLVTESKIRNLDIDNINWFDRKLAIYNYNDGLDNLSDIDLGICIVAPSVLFADKNIRNDFIDIGIMYSEVLALSYLVPVVVKKIVHRERPYLYGNIDAIDIDDIDGQKSFFSGHTTAAFAATTFLSTIYSNYYGNNYLVWTSGILLASSVGILRYKSGSHFPTDIIVGGIVGTGIGYLIPTIHKKGSKDFQNVSLIINKNEIKTIFYFN